MAPFVFEYKAIKSIDDYYWWWDDDAIIVGWTGEDICKYTPIFLFLIGLYFILLIEKYFETHTSEELWIYLFV